MNYDILNLGDTWRRIELIFKDGELCRSSDHHCTSLCIKSHSLCSICTYKNSKKTANTRGEKKGGIKEK